MECFSDEPKSARKPIRLAPKSKPDSPGPSTPSRIGPSIDRTVSSVTPASVPNPSSSPTKKRTPRQTKKGKAEEEQAKREVYAQELFTELNKIVFGDGLPKETKLKWSNRLLSTAGKARFHRYVSSYL